MNVFGEYEGKPVEIIRLHNEKLCAEILSYGATLRALWVPDRDGKPLDVVLGFDTLEAYVKHDSCFGATVGPVANRIALAACPLNGKMLRLTANDRGNCLHSGVAGLQNKLWDVVERSETAVTLRYVHPNGLGGLPGPVEIELRYRLDGSALLAEYRAISERDTLFSPTNHSYFNLDGHDSGSVLDHRLRLYAHSFTPTDERSIPTGAIRAVSGAALDFTRPVRVGERIDAPNEQLRLAGGYDHNFVIDAGEEAFRPAAELWAARSGIKLTVSTDRPGVQLYTGNYIPAGLAGKNGAVYGPRHGLCLETQGFPDAPHHSAFPSVVLRAGTEWTSRTRFEFT